MTEQLFRPEAVDAQSASSGLYGQTTGVLPPAWSRITILLLCFMITLFCFLMSVDFARKETVRGKLRPVAPEARVYASEPGVISSVLVEDGAAVKAGDRLVSITSERILADGGRLSEDAISALIRERDLLNERLSQLDDATAISLDEVRQLSSDARRQETDGQVELMVLQDRLTVARARAEDTKQFLEEGLITSSEHMMRDDAVATLNQSRLQLEADIRDAQAAQSRLSIEQRRIRSDHRRDRADIGQRIARLEAQIRQTEASAEHIVVAPISGNVSALQARIGVRADTSVPLLTIGEVGADLMAVLYLPSRAIAFVEPGQAVKLQYDALPYQKFGMANAEIIRISSTSLQPGELGLAVQNPEPLYRVEARLDQQSVYAFGQDIEMLSGMELTADIILENRKLIEWLLEPIAALRGM